MRFVALRALLFAVLVLAARWAAADDAALLATGRSLSDAFEQGDLQAVYARGTPAWREGVGGVAGLAELRERVLREEGPATGVIQEAAHGDGASPTYRRIVRRNVGGMPSLMEWTFDREGRVVALDIHPQPVAMPSGKVGY